MRSLSSLSPKKKRLIFEPMVCGCSTCGVAAEAAEMGVSREAGDLI